MYSMAATSFAIGAGHAKPHRRHQVQTLLRGLQQRLGAFGETRRPGFGIADLRRFVEAGAVARVAELVVYGVAAQGPRRQLLSRRFRRRRTLGTCKQSLPNGRVRSLMSATVPAGTA